METFKGPLKGHSLYSKGRIRGAGSGPGTARCSCGIESPVLPNTPARQRWHSDVHKPEMAAAQRAISEPRCSACGLLISAHPLQLLEGCRKGLDG